MDFAELARARRSVRQFYHVYVVHDQKRRDDLAAAAHGQQFVAQAPVVLVFCAHPERSATRYADRGRALYSVQDATIACTYAMLAAADAGLSSVWVGAFDDDAVAAAIDAPAALRPVAVLPIGYAAETPSLTDRRAIEEFATTI
jgi:nitroreductase